MKSAFEIAEQLVTHLNAVGGEGAVVSFKAVGPLLVPVIDRVLPDASVQVQPWSETEEATDRGDMLAGVREVNVLLSAPLEGLSELKCSQWLSEVKDSFGELTLAVGSERWRWRGNETVVLFDSDAAKDKSQYLSIFRATFFNYA